MTDLRHRHCQPQTGTALERAVAERHLREIPGWALDDGGHSIQRTFAFPDYYATIAFVNAIAWIANREDHHPDLEVGYNRCTVRFSTHSVGGLSDNDFICAAQISALFD
ncbi:MAG TPA: 4a-hydroxytetrahydrobiopterin dehydratase [Gammaproteobacteria bacterium]|nr:4a-hydroxytetrahydrobiopterin dehydratase [Gammaproteobacteria bacterium]